MYPQKMRVPPPWGHNRRRPGRGSNRGPLGPKSDALPTAPVRSDCASPLCFRQQRVVVNGVKSDWVPVVSGVPKGTVLGPLLFSLYINDIPIGIDSQIRLFADDCVCYREIRTGEDTMKLQKDIDLLESWARKWGKRFQPVKCNMMQLTNKRINKIEASYTLEGTVLENVDSIKYLGVTITNDLKWNIPISPISVLKQTEHLDS